ncbi:MAG TPA: hypothetical protein VN893_09715 [Bryobacteraceae bacterium]|nr:hypothetical protein [Bryobacteraceae bacterium]
MKTRILSLALLALSAAAAKDFTVSLNQPATVAGKSLAAGEYKLAVHDGMATIWDWKNKVEIPVKVVESDQKYSSTTVRLDTANGHNVVQEIKLAGTKTRLVFGETEAPMAGGGSTKANP